MVKRLSPYCCSSFKLGSIFTGSKEKSLGFGFISWATAGAKGTPAMRRRRTKKLDGTERVLGKKTPEDFAHHAKIDLVPQGSDSGGPADDASPNRGSGFLPFPARFVKGSRSQEMASDRVLGRGRPLHGSE